MGEEDVDQQYQQLLEELAHLVALLREYGEPAWAEWSLLEARDRPAP